MNRTVFAVGLASAVAVLSPLSAQQSAPVAEYVAVTNVTVRPGGFAEFEDYAKKVQAAATKIGLKQRVDAYQVAQGGSIYSYDFVSTHATLAELDSVPSVPSMLLKAYGEIEGNKLLRAGRAQVASTETFVVRMRSEFSTKPKGVAGVPFVQLVRAEIDPAMLTQYEDYLTKVKAAGDKHAGAPTAIRHSSVFGQSNVFISALPFATYAEREKWPSPLAILTAAYGEAEARQLQETARRAQKRLDIWVVAYRRDLSRLAGPTTN